MAVANIDPEPGAGFKSGAGSGLRRSLAYQKLLRLRQTGAVCLDQSEGDIFSTALRQQALRQLLIGRVRFNRRKQCCQQAVAVGSADLFGSGWSKPFRRNPRAPQHTFNPAAARIRHQQDRCALLPGPASAAGTMLQCFRIARHFDMDHQRKARQVNPARRDIGGHTDPGAPVAQGLQRVVAFVLAVLARKGNHGKAAFSQAGMQVAYIITRGAKQDRGFRFVEPQQVDHGVLDIRRSNGHGLIGNIAMTAIGVGSGNAQGIALVTLGQRDNRLGHGCREQQGAAAIRRGIQQFLKILTKAHVEHFVRFIEHRDSQTGKVKGAAFQMVAQAARRPDDDMCPVIERTPLAHRVHAANTGDNAGTGRLVKPGKLAADLQGQFTGWRNHQGQRGGCGQHLSIR